MDFSKSQYYFCSHNTKTSLKAMYITGALEQNRILFNQDRQDSL